VSATSAPSSVVVIGAGYVGLVTAVGLASLGHDVALVETRADRRDNLLSGRVPLFEAGLQSAFDDARADGRLHVRESVPPTAGAGFYLVCVGTPIDETGESDLSQVRAALEELSSRVTERDVIVIRSTLPVGTTHRLVDGSGLPREQVVTNPEFLRQGTALHDFLHPDRVVIGRFEETSARTLDRTKELLGSLGAPVLVTDINGAELVKNGANTFLALKLSFTSEIAALCEAYGADVTAVLDGITRDPRIGQTYMKPSFGFGGSCLPKELQTLTRAGNAVGLPMHVTSAASQANVAQQDRFIERIVRLLGGTSGRRVALLGLAFKAGTDDVRDSPALRVASVLLVRGVEVVAHDPQAGANAQRALPDLRIVDGAEAAIDGADAAVIATEWPEYRALDWESLKSRMSTALVVDGRRLLDPQEMRRLGYRYAAVGTPDE
jgi:UDPglucose 6-dehydrogenase